jgi:Fe-S-cluster-containing hydrogenase component 2
MTKRKIIEIDEEKCNGCGLCALACAEGAIQIVGGKARLVSDVYCDGLGACLGECPQGAIAIIERDAVPFDEAAAQRHVAQLRQPQAAAVLCSGGCPGSRVQDFRLDLLPAAPDAPKAPASSSPSALRNWPIQLHLLPPNAPFLHHADLLLVADCVPFALADFHERYLQGRPVAIACPKLDDTQPYVEKLATIFAFGSIRSLTVVHMEVPCCTGLVRIAQAARQAAGVAVPLHEVVISTRGAVVRETDEAR